MNIYIVILHIGDLDVTKKCIESLKKYEFFFGRIIVVNNDTTTLSQKDFPLSRVTVINNKKNLGFAGGINVGISYALKNQSDAILLLNNDTYIKQPFLKKLVNVFKTNKKVGIVGPAICFEKNGKEIFDIGGSINMHTGRTRHREVEHIKDFGLQYVTYITGAAMLIKREVFENVGLFDEHFFLYYEDADFCLRARKKGFEIVVEPKAVVYHLLSKTIGKVTPLAIYYQTRSALIFGRKYMKTPVQKLAHAIFLFSQTALITLKHPKAGFVGWKGMLE